MSWGILTPSKVAAWLECEHSLTLQRAVELGQIDAPSAGSGAFARLVMDKGEQHEAACRADYERQGRRVVAVPPRERAESFGTWVQRVGGVLHEGHDVLFQMPFLHDGMRGIADFLERVDLPDGAFTYEPVDAKLARSEAKPGHVLQLAFYADAVEAEALMLPDHLHVWLASGRRETIRTREVRAYWHRLKARLSDAMVSLEDAETTPVPCRHCDFCPFAGHCDQVWRDQDALHLVAGIRGPERDALLHAGVDTLERLGSSVDEVAGLETARLRRLRRQAALQQAARDTRDDEPPPFEQIAAGGEPPWGHGHELLPEPDGGDVFLDFEGHPFWRPDAGLFFLFGFIARGDDGGWVYTGRWAHDLDEEREATRWLIDLLFERLERYPDAHIYHYNHTERSALQALVVRHHLDDTRLGTLVREGAFVDLFAVVRNAVQIGVESYSLKEVERLADYRRGQDITAGSGAVVEYDDFAAAIPADERQSADHTSDPRLESIAAYNEDDVRATMAVRDWLLRIRPPGTPWRPARLDEAPSDDEVDALVAALREQDTVDALLAADLLDYWAREGRAHAAQLRVRAEAPLDELRLDEQAIGGLHSPREVERFTPTGRKAKHPGIALRFPDQPVAGFPRAMYLTEEGAPAYCDVDRLDRSAGQVVVVLGPDARERGDVPVAIVENDWVDPSSKRPALTAWAQAAADAGSVDAVGDARSRLLARHPTRFVPGGGPPGGEFTDDLDELADWVDALDGSWLAVQGPPGTGKTYRGAQVIKELVLRGRRVGITAMSHTAIHNLVAATHEAFAEAGELDRLAAVVRRPSEPEVPLDGVSYASTNKRCESSEHNVVAGTTWLFASGALRAHPVDVLVIDEAGQLALVDVVAAAGTTTNLVLLGDPNQLPHVALASHPGGSGASVLEHILAGDETLQPHTGVFLPESRRMHPDVCDFISEQFYEGRLTSHPSCSVQTTHEGTGLRWLRAHHTGCATRSLEEVELIVAEAGRLVTGAWTDDEGRRRRLRAEDLMVVTPYNDQKDALRRGLNAAGLAGVRAGTVDRFQGQEAPVVFFSAATSSAESAPRGLGFVFSRNRFNVAISRARCLAYLVCTDTILDATARTVEEMRTLSSACAFVATATTN